MCLAASLSGIPGNHWPHSASRFRPAGPGAGVERKLPGLSQAHPMQRQEHSGPDPFSGL